MLHLKIQHFIRPLIGHMINGGKDLWLPHPIYATAGSKGPPFCLGLAVQLVPKMASWTLLSNQLPALSRIMTFSVYLFTSRTNPPKEKLCNLVITITTTTVKWFLDVKTFAALEREGSWNQSAQPTTTPPKSGAVAASWKGWFSRNENTWAWYGYNIKHLCTCP